MPSDHQQRTRLTNFGLGPLHIDFGLWKWDEIRLLTQGPVEARPDRDRCPPVGVVKRRTTAVGVLSNLVFLNGLFWAEFWLFGRYRAASSLYNHSE